MAQKTDAQLTTEKNVIKTETIAKANTAARIGTMFEDTIDSKINNDKIDTDNGLATSGKTVPGRDAVKAYIAAQLAALDQLFLGLYVSLAALETAHPTAESGQYAIVDPGSGTDAVKYIWDEDEGWVAGSSSGIATWGTIIGTLSDQSDLLAALNAKLNAIPEYVAATGARTLNSGDLALVNAGEQVEIQGNNGGALTIPLNSSVAFPIGTLIYASGFTGSVIATGGVTITGTRGDLVFPSGQVIALYKSATDTWQIDNGLPDASSTVKGLVELATDAEAITGTDTVRATTPANVKAVADLKETLTNKVTDFSTINNTLYPSVEAVNNQINALIVAQISYSDLNLTGL